ncbi:MAG: efflux RND transporter periplasmic adaptor subunit [Candidatus Sumerlaeales bacterium]|nr:efflux RND transporter periplasmic adaptor subunit [Candidatus Sumerlaeales bacterium]
MQHRTIVPIIVASLAAASLLCLQACKEKQAATTAQTPPAMVVADTVKKEIVPWVAEYTAQTKAVDSVNIVPQVTGIIMEAPFKEGSLVEKGSVLFKIDPRPFEAQLQQEMANLAQTSAALSLAQAEVARYQPLVAQNAAPKQDLDVKIAQRDSNLAKILANEAAIQVAKLNLEYTTIKAPITGEVGQRLLTVGNVANANSSNLVSLVSVNPIYATFHISESDYLIYTKSKGAVNKMVFELVLENSEVLPEPAKLDMMDNQVDKKTGTIAVRVSHPNTDGKLKPNQFCRVRITIKSDEKPSLVIPQSAVIEVQGTRSVYVLDEKNTVSQRSVEMGQRLENMKWVVLSGLSYDERIIVEGQLKTSPGATVTPTTKEQANTIIDKTISDGNKEKAEYEKSFSKDDKASTATEKE